MRVALIGYGKMGHEIEKTLFFRGHTVALIIDKENVADLCPQKMKDIDVAIEFSAPSVAYDNVVNALRCGVPVVCGTTAWVERLEEVKKLCVELDGAFFYASNYSVGVNLMFRINTMLARLMEPFPQYDVTIDEVHHTAKVDAPSGTAVTLAEEILEGISRKKSWVLGASINSEELNVGAVRRSTVPGTHNVVWDSPVDEITITHRAKSRAGFAEGAVLAAEFLIGKKGFFSMDDLLK
ncbi:MAG: 4-hydroxy-tetrahydrodipicolinate reductase [Rikenellaceae bacterium]